MLAGQKEILLEQSRTNYILPACGGGRMSTELSTKNEFVADVDRAVNFYRDMLGLPLTFGVSLRVA